MSAQALATVMGPPLMLHSASAQPGSEIDHAQPIAVLRYLLQIWPQPQIQHHQTNPAVLSSATNIMGGQMGVGPGAALGLGMGLDMGVKMDVGAGVGAGMTLSAGLNAGSLSNMAVGVSGNVQKLSKCVLFVRAININEKCSAVNRAYLYAIRHIDAIDM